MQDISLSVLPVIEAKNGAARPTYGRREIRGIAPIVTMLEMAEEAQMGRSFRTTASKWGKDAGCPDGRAVRVLPELPTTWGKSA